MILKIHTFLNQYSEMINYLYLYKIHVKKCSNLDTKRVAIITHSWVLYAIWFGSYKEWQHHDVAIRYKTILCVTLHKDIKYRVIMEHVLYIMKKLEF